MALKILARGTTKKPAQDFVRQLRRCTGLRMRLAANGELSIGGGRPSAGQRPLADTLRELVREARTTGLVIRVGRGQRNVFVDNFCLREVDLDDLQRFPERPPSGFPDATTRCELLAHFLAEYLAALKKGRTRCTAGFRDAHRAGVAAQTAHRRANGQAGPAHDNKQTKKKAVFSYCNGSRTEVRVRRGNAGRPRHFKAPARKRPPAGAPARRPKGATARTLRSLYRASQFVFVAEAEDLPAPPGQWSNLVLTYQPVCCRVTRPLKGEVPGSERPFVVQHLLVEGSATARAERPGLDPTLFGADGQILVFARLDVSPRDKGLFRLETTDPDFGLLPALPELVEIVAGAGGRR